MTVPAGAEKIQWKLFLNTAWLMALIAGLLAGFIPLLGIVLLLPLTVVIAVRMYRKRHFVGLRAGQGARLGFVMGLISFCGFAPVFAAVISLNQTLHQQVVDGISQAAARNPDPQMRQMELMFKTPQGFAILVGFFLIMLLAVILLVSSAAGALAARSAGRQTR